MDVKPSDHSFSGKVYKFELFNFKSFHWILQENNERQLRINFNKVYILLNLPFLAEYIHQLPYYCKTRKQKSSKLPKETRDLK